MPRRSARIRALSGPPSEEAENYLASEENTAAKRKRSATPISRSSTTRAAQNKKSAAKKRTPVKKTDDESSEEDRACLPRTRELELLNSSSSDIKYVMGIDEAGRGPLAGPVVAAAVVCSTDIPGVVDSKKITKEEDREALFETIMQQKLEDIHWAVAVIDAAKIDEINILQATLLGMRLCASALVDPDSLLLDNKDTLRVVDKASIDEPGCYVVHSENIDQTTVKKGNKTNKKAKKTSKPEEDDAGTASSSSPYFALIDGNKVPKSMPCPAESMVKGDSREFCIAAASILAKVTRDRLMHGYDKLYPEYNLCQHKGYPTAAHMKAVFEHGASPIHRRTFAPLKHMEFDDKTGAVIKKKEE